MAPSKLFQNAFAALGAKQGQWTATSAKIASIDGPDVQNQSGRDIVRMLQTEHHLSSDPVAALPDIMKELLEELCELDWIKPPGDVASAYQNLVGRFGRKGPPIGVTPGWLFRYVNGGGLFEQIAKQLDASGKSAYSTALRRLISEAKVGTGSTWRDVLLFLQDDALWKAVPKNAVRLSGGESTFVTFDVTRRNIANTDTGRCWLVSLLP
jgi:hypothetical protein